MKTAPENHFIDRGLIAAGVNVSRELPRSERFWKHLEPLQGALEMYCRRSVNDASAAEDVLQNAVMKSFTSFDSFAEGSNFRAWIYRYLNLEIMAENRRSQVRPLRDQPPELLDDDDWTLAFDESYFTALLHSPERVLEGCDDVLAEAVRNLDPVERSTLLLKAVGGFKFREIAEIMAMPMGTIMSSLARARQRLRHELVEYGREYGLLTPHQSRRKA